MSIPEPHTIDDLFSFALVMEREAARRYGELAETMDRHGNPETAAVFRQLAEEERRHVLHVEAHLGENADGAASPGAPAAGAETEGVPEDIEDAGGPYLMTPYRALHIAVRNEERAFALYTGIAAQTDRRDLQARAEALAREELEHVLRLRLERRRAFRAEAKAGSLRFPPLDTLPPERAVVAIARRLRAWLDAGADRLIALGDDRAARTLAELAIALEPSTAGAAEARSEGENARAAFAGNGSIYEVLRDALRALDEAFDALATASGTWESAESEKVAALSEILIKAIAAVRAELDRVVGARETEPSP